MKSNKLWKKITQSSKFIDSASYPTFREMVALYDSNLESFTLILLSIDRPKSIKRLPDVLQRLYLAAATISITVIKTNHLPFSIKSAS